MSDGGVADRTASGAPQETALIPLVLGVTGHRELRAEDVPKLEAAVRGVIDDLHRAAPATPIVLLTPLAEGADRLVARVVLDAGGELIAALPFEADEYRRDFPNSVAAFDVLYCDARTTRRLVMPPLHRQRVDGNARPRELQYALVGAYVARHSQVLLALWDGEPSDGLGGTAEIVRFRRTGQYDVDDDIADAMSSAGNPYGLSDLPLDPHDVGPVYHILTPRAGRRSPDDLFSGRWLDDDREARRGSTPLPRALATSLARIDAFNQDALIIGARAPASVEQSERSLYAAPDGSCPPPVSPLRRAFALADTLAIGYQRQTFRVLTLLHALAFLAVLFFEIYGHLFPPEDVRITAFLAAYLVTLGVADVIYLYARRKQSQTRFQDYRAVAEGLRVQFYWRLAGLEDSGADYYLRKQKDELSWIRDAIRAWSVRAAPANPGDVQALAARWIAAERDYFGRAAEREGRRLATYRAVAGGVILASLLWAVPIAAAGLHLAPRGQFNWLSALQVPLLIVSVVLAWHLAFKGSLMVKESRQRGARAWLPEVRIFGVSTLLGLVFLAGVHVARGWLHERWPIIPDDSHAWIVVALGLVTVVGALVHSYTEKRAFGEHAHQYARMGEIFARAGDRMSALLHDGKEQRARALAVELGKEALAEHGDWLMLHRERPMELPKVEL